MNKVGSREDVMNGIAKKTTGGLTKQKLKYNKEGKIVSRKVSNIAKKNNKLGKTRYKTKNKYNGGQVGGEIWANQIIFNFIYFKYKVSDKKTYIFVSSNNERLVIDNTSITYNNKSYNIYSFAVINNKGFKIVTTCNNIIILKKSLIYPITVVGIFILNDWLETNNMLTDDRIIQSKWQGLSVRNQSHYNDEFIKLVKFKLINIPYNLRITYTTDSEINDDILYETIDAFYNTDIYHYCYKNYDIVYSRNYYREKALDKFKQDYGSSFPKGLFNSYPENEPHSLEDQLQDNKYNTAFIILYKGFDIKAIAFLVGATLNIIIAMRPFGSKMMLYIKNKYNYSVVTPLYVTPSSKDTDKLIQFYNRPWIHLMVHNYIRYMKCKLEFQYDDKLISSKCIKCKITITEKHRESTTNHGIPPLLEDTFTVIFKYDDIKQFLSYSQINSLNIVHNNTVENYKQNFINRLNELIKSSKNLLLKLSKYFKSKRENTNKYSKCVDIFGIEIISLKYKSRENNCFSIDITCNDNNVYYIKFRYNDISHLLLSSNNNILSKTISGKRARTQNPGLFIEKLNELCLKSSEFKKSLLQILLKLDYNTTRCK